MKIIRSIAEMQGWALRSRREGRSIGFVPTMGALHEGHLSLVRRSVRENDRTVVSIYVNPLQFGPHEDFRRYPRTFAQDAKALRRGKVDVLFSPSDAEMYPAEARARVEVGDLGRILEGKSRPGHFTGVATVVAKLFGIVQPTRAYFGLKDYQQVRVISRMIEDLNIPVHLVACPTFREKDGLAASSRNSYLSPREREEAVKIYQALYLGRELVSLRIMKDSKPLLRRLAQVLSTIPKSRLDYLAVVDPVTLEPMKKIRRPALLAAALWIGRTRLIDNVVIP
jgi:pantoate--beta-alanine ligase